MPSTPLDYQKTQKVLWYTPIFWQCLFLYQRMPIGLNILPSIWQSYINAILDCLQNKKYCEAIMDDLLLFTPSKRSHRDKLEDLLKALLKNGLKISPKKCQLFRTNLQYMGTTLEEQVTGYTKTTTSNYSERLQEHCRNGKFFSMFCPDLQKLLKPI